MSRTYDLDRACEADFIGGDEGGGHDSFCSVRVRRSQGGAAGAFDFVQPERDGVVQSCAILQQCGEARARAPHCFPHLRRGDVRWRDPLGPACADQRLQPIG